MIFKLIKKLFRISFVLFIFYSSFSLATTYTVTSNTDSGAGSFRDAITQANAHPNDASGPDKILFNITGDSTINLQTILPAITDAVVIDGMNQANSQKVTLEGSTVNLDAANDCYLNMVSRNQLGAQIAGTTPDLPLLVIGSKTNPTVAINADGSVIRNLILKESYNNPSNIVGANTFRQLLPNSTRGPCIGIAIYNSNNDVIENNELSNFILGNAAINARTFTSQINNNVTMRNNIINGSNAGLEYDNVSNSTITSNVIHGGITLNDGESIFVRGNNETITKNIIDSARAGIVMRPSSVTDATLQGGLISGNKITTVSLLGLSLSGFSTVTNNIVDVSTSTGIAAGFVQGHDLIENNEFKNGAVGVDFVSSLTTPTTVIPMVNNTVLNNSIYNFSKLGILIDFTTGSLTTAANSGKIFPNDPLDTDGVQNFPVIDASRSSINPALSQIYGSLDSKANTIYLIQVYSNPSSSGVCYPASSVLFPITVALGCTATNPYLVADGQAFIGEIMVQTDANGHADFHLVAKAGTPVGSLVAATATEMDSDGNGGFIPGNTSPFSEGVDLLTHGSSTAYLNADGAAGGDKGDVLMFPLDDGSDTTLSN